MDVLSRIREILSRKRNYQNRAPELDDGTLDGSIPKKIRTANYYNDYKSTLNSMADASRYSCANHPMSSHRLHNGVSNMHDTVEQPAYRQPLVNGHHNAVPGLLPGRRKFQLTNRSMQPKQTVGPMFQFGSELEKFNRIPDLCPVTQPMYNNSLYRSATQQSSRFDEPLRVLDVGFKKPDQISFSTRRQPAITDSRSLLQRLTSNAHSSRQHKAIVESPPPDRNAYQALLDKLLPTKLKKPSKFLPSFTKSNHSTVDISDEADDTSSVSSNKSKYEPVNSLRARFEASPIYKDSYENDLNKQYSDRSLLRQQKLSTQSERTALAEQQSRETEDKYYETFQKLSLETYGLDVEEEEEPANDYPPLDEEKQRKVCQWMAGRDTGTVLNSKFSINISRHDIQTLSWSPLQWLNDEVINFYMELVAERSRLNDKLPKVHVMNTFFLKRLYEAGHAGVRRWTRKVDIFAFDVIPVPVHKGIHWCMAVIHLKNKTIKYYDSMGAPNNQALNALVDYLKEESLDKKKQPLDMTGWSTENVQGIPQQENGSDCGVFSCMYAEFVCRNRPIVFTQQNMHYFRMKMIYEICTGKMLN